MLAEVVESLKKTGLQGVPADHCYAGPGDVSCDVCTGRRLKAVKTCLQCLVSYCDPHLQPHYQSPAFKKHKLVKATTSAASERTERQKELDTSLQNIQQRIQEREKDVKVLHQEVESINHCADRAVEDSDTIFTELISSMERRRSEVKQQIREQQECQVSNAEERRRHVEQEVTELRRRHAELEKLSLTEDHIHFLQRFTSSLSRISESTHPVSSHVRPLRYFEDVTVAVSKMRDKLEDVLTEEGTNVSETVNRVDVSPSTPAEPKTRTEFLRYFRPITLDPNTANPHLSLSKRNRKVTWMDKPQSYPVHPERFTAWAQVLSREALTERCYWEAEWSGGSVIIAVSYEDISRTGGGYGCGFGYNDKSWCLQCTKQGYQFRHRGIETKIPGRVWSRVAVYLDHSEGTLSFYSVSADTMTFLHTVHNTFTHNLHAGLLLSPGDTAELC